MHVPKPEDRVAVEMEVKYFRWHTGKSTYLVWLFRRLRGLASHTVLPFSMFAIKVCAIFLLRRGCNISSTNCGLWNTPYGIHRTSLTEAVMAPVHGFKNANIHPNVFSLDHFKGRLFIFVLSACNISLIVQPLNRRTTWETSWSTAHTAPLEACTKWYAGDQ